MSSDLNSTLRNEPTSGIVLPSPWANPRLPKCDLDKYRKDAGYIVWWAIRFGFWPCLIAPKGAVFRTRHGDRIASGKTPLGKAWGLLSSRFADPGAYRERAGGRNSARQLGRRRAHHSGLRGRSAAHPVRLRSSMSWAIQLLSADGFPTTPSVFSS